MAEWSLFDKAEYFRKGERELIASWLRVAHFHGFCLWHCAELIESGEFREMFKGEGDGQQA